MLEGLLQVAWTGGKHIYGDSDAIPAYIRNLLSPIRAERKTALDNLFGAQEERGIVTPYTPLIILFALELLAAPDTPGKGEFMFCISVLADCLYRNVGGRNSHTLQARVNLQTGIPIYLTLLSDSSAAIRSGAASILATFPTLAEQLIGPLEKALATETEPTVKVWLNAALKRLRKEAMPHGGPSQPNANSS